MIKRRLSQFFLELGTIYEKNAVLPLLAPLKLFLEKFHEVVSQTTGTTEAKEATQSKVLSDNLRTQIIYLILGVSQICEKIRFFSGFYVIWLRMRKFQFE
jgi:hypothetical protein